MRLKQFVFDVSIDTNNNNNTVALLWKSFYFGKISRNKIDIILHREDELYLMDGIFLSKTSRVFMVYNIG